MHLLLFPTEEVFGSIYNIDTFSVLTIKSNSYEIIKI